MREFERFGPTIEPPREPYAKRQFEGASSGNRVSQDNDVPFVGTDQQSVGTFAVEVPLHSASQGRAPSLGPRSAPVGLEACVMGSDRVAPTDLPVRARIARALAAALALLLVVEGGLRLTPPPPFVPPAPLRGRAVQFAEEPLVRADYEMRTPPFPRRKASGATRVVCCGSSSTYGLGLPPQGAWPWRLDCLAAGPEVVNLARVGATSSDQVEIVRAALALEPDCVVVMEGNNEFLPIMAATAEGRPLDARAERLLVAVCRVSRIAGWLRAGLVRGPASPSANAPAALARDGQAPDAPAPHDLASVQVTDDEIALARVVYQENLREIARLCQEAGVPLVICTVPVNTAWPPALETDRHPLRTRPDFNAVARAVAEESGARLCDVDGFASQLFLDACHLNDVGSRRAAAQVLATIHAAGLASGSALDRSDGDLSGWIDLAQFGDVPSFLAARAQALPAPLVEAVRSAYARHSSVSFALADALPPLDIAHTRDLPTLALYGHLLMTAHRYPRAAVVYARAAAIDARASTDLGWARCFAGDEKGACAAWRRTAVDRVTDRAQHTLAGAGGAREGGR